MSSDADEFFTVKTLTSLRRSLTSISVGAFGMKSVTTSPTVRHLRPYVMTLWGRMAACKKVKLIPINNHGPESRWWTYGIRGLGVMDISGVFKFVCFLKAAHQNATFDKAVRLPSEGEFELFYCTKTESKL